MKRVLLGILLVAAALVLADYWERSSRLRQRTADSEFFILARAEIDSVSEIHIQTADRAVDWRYRRVDGHWRYPAYHDAFAQPSAVDRLLRSLLSSSATVVSVDADEQEHFGLGAKSLRIQLRDAAGGEVLDILAGRGAPGPGAAEAYVRRTAADTVFHLHANPLLTLFGGNPPLLDPHLLPRALERRSVAKIRFLSGGNSPAPTRALSLRRVEISPLALPAAGRPLGPTFAWVAEFPAGEDTVLSENAYALVSFIQRLKFAALHEPENSRSRFKSDMDKLELIDDDGVVDLLLVGDEEGEDTFVHHTTTGQTMTMTSTKVALMFPTRAALTDTLPSPDPYQQARPFGR